MKFDRSWLREAGFKEEVARWWAAHEVEDPATVRLTSKLGATTRSPHGSSEEGLGA